MARQKSESGAYMSQYDTEVEKRLDALEAAVAELQSHTHDGVDPNQIHELKKAIFENGISPDRFDEVERKLNKLVYDVHNEWEYLKEEGE
jgi:hypothetical protein